MNYEEALAYIHNVAWFGKKVGLHRMTKLLERMGNPHKELKFVHVAGTNGKGSTCSMIASVLKQAGYKTGMFTSPYIHVFNERIQINGEMISDKDLIQIVEFVKGFIDELEEEETPTVFEVITLIGMEYFRRQKCDIVVLEVGIGGLLDSTNVIDTKEVAVITSIGFDHTAMLGNTIEEIAEQKAGIIKENTDVVFWAKDTKCLEIIKNTCKKTNSKLYCPKYEELISKEYNLFSQTFDYKQYNNVKIHLSGLYQLENALIAITALEVLAKKGYQITKEHILSGLSKAIWIGRFQVIKTEPVIIVDGSHNPPGMKATAESLKKHFPEQKIIFILGVMGDKELDAMIQYILPLAKEFITVTPDNKRAMKAEELAFYLQKKGAKAKAFSCVKEACKEVMAKAKKDSVICALGSLYLVDEIQKSLNM